jgi:hypothetical protein
MLADQADANRSKIAHERSEGQMLLPAPPTTRSGRAAAALRDRWNTLRNDVRLIVEDHMIAAPVIGLAAGFLAGRLLNAALGRPRDYRRGW